MIGDNMLVSFVFKAPNDVIFGKVIHSVRGSYFRPKSAGISPQ